MLLAVFAILGIPIWFIAGMLGAALWSRHQFKKQSGVFRLKEKPMGDEGWPRFMAYGRVIHDVLVINTGLALMQTSIRGIVDVDILSDPVEDPPFEDASVVQVTFDDSSTVQIAVEKDAALQLSRG